MSFITTWLKKLGEVFTSLTKGAQKVWDKTEPKIKLAIFWGSGIVNILNKFLNQDAPFVLEALRQEFPELEPKFEAIFTEVATDLNLLDKGVSPDLLTTLQAVLGFLASRTGQKWAKDSEFVANTIALFLSPDGTIYGKIGTIMWWVYETFIKKGATVQQVVK